MNKNCKKLHDPQCVKQKEGKKEQEEERARVSKSSLKRSAAALKQLGLTLVSLGKNPLNKMSLDDNLQAAMKLSQRMKREGLRRQIQLIRKMLRVQDLKPIQQALDRLNN